jgi:ubiquinone/menaquinone biosynthesis C-methylase UbiE
MTAQATRFVGQIPENYDQGLGPHLFIEYAGDLARRVADLRPATVLELAAGTGIATRKLRDALASDCELLASDLNTPMLEVAKAKFQPHESVRFEQVDAMDLEFDEASFDVVSCQFGVMFFPDKDHSYAEVFRVLKPGGSYLFNVWDSWGSNPYAQITHEVVQAFFPEDPPGFYKIPFGYHDADEIKKSVLRAGFSQVSIEHLPLKSKILSADRFAKGLVFGNPFHEEIVTRGGDPDAICATVAEAIDRQLGSEVSLQALIVHASKS